MPRLLPVLLFALLAVGCTDPEPDTPPTADPPPPAATPAEARPEAAGSFTLPPSMTDTLVVEGDPQPVTLMLVQETDGAMPFATYIPEGMTHEASASGEGESHRFTVGSPPYQGSVMLFIPSEGSGLDDPRAYAQALAGEGVALEPLADAARWVQAGYQWTYDDRFANVQAGTRGGRRFYIVEDLQVEMMDGFAPQSGAVLSHWLWLPDGTYLIDHF